MGKTVVFDGKMGMRKFGSTAPPFGKVACAVKVYTQNILQRFNKQNLNPVSTPRIIGLKLKKNIE